MKARKCIIGMMLVLLGLPVYAVGALQPKTCRTMPPQGTVALTFDDGPSKTYTQKILTILEHYHVKATFFVLGVQVKKHPEYLKQMIADGDVIGDHSMTHPQIPKLAQGSLYNEIVNSKNVIHNVTGSYPRLFRFPYGANDQRVKQYVLSQGMLPVFWGNDPDDFRRPGANIIASRVVSNAHSGQIILLHDGPARRQQTVDALPQIIEGIQKKGLRFSVLCT